MDGFGAVSNGAGSEGGSSGDVSSGVKSIDCSSSLMLVIFFEISSTSYVGLVVGSATSYVGVIVGSGSAHRVTVSLKFHSHTLHDSLKVSKVKPVPQNLLLIQSNNLCYDVIELISLNFKFDNSLFMTLPTNVEITGFHELET